MTDGSELGLFASLGAKQEANRRAAWQKNDTQTRPKYDQAHMDAVCFTEDELFGMIRFRDHYNFTRPVDFSPVLANGVLIILRMSGRFNNKDIVSLKHTMDTLQSPM